jgi:hemolysin
MKCKTKKYNSITSNILVLSAVQGLVCGYSGNAFSDDMFAAENTIESQFEAQQNSTIPAYIETAFAQDFKARGYVNQNGYLKTSGSANKSTADVIYVNVAQWRTGDTFALRTAYEAGKVLLLDATEASSKQMSDVSTAIGGLGLDSPVMVIHLNKGKPDYRNITIDIDTPGQMPGLGQVNRNYATFFATATNRANLAAPIDSIVKTLSSAQAPAKATAMVNGASPSTMAVTTPYAPIYTYQVRTTKVINCPLYEAINFGANTFKGSKVDRCAGQGNSDLLWTVDLMRSVPAVTSDGISSIDAKYVRISVLNTNGGSGIHLVNNLTQYFTWKQSNAQWDDYIGPFANKYIFSIGATDYSNLTLVNHSPAQTNPQVSVAVTNSVTIGVSGKAGVSNGSNGPTDSAEVSASYAYTSSRTTTVAGNEYMVKNNTGAIPGTAQWVWDRNYDTNLCDWASYYGHGPSSGCRWEPLIWDTKHIMNTGRFTPIAYSNFVPAFSVLYKTKDVKFTGIKNFRIIASMDIRGIAGAARYRVFFQDRRVFGWNQISSTLADQTITVDFSRPVFYPEVNVVLQSLNESNSCVDVYKANTANGAFVGKWTCGYSGNQFWGLNSNEQYVSRVAPDRCLTVINPTSITSSACTNALNAKWYWNGNTLMSRYVDAQGNRDYRLAIVNGSLGVIRAGVLGSTDWNNYMVNPN